MNTDTLAELRARLQSAPRKLDDLHQAARAAGSDWSRDQVALVLACLPEVETDGNMWRLQATSEDDPLTAALLSIASSTPVPAAALLRRLPGGVVASAAALCEAARIHPDLELLPGSRIRRR